MRPLSAFFRPALQTGAVGLAILLASCGDSPTAPQAPLGPQPPTLPPGTSGQEVAPVFGVAYAHTQNGAAPLAGLPVRARGIREPNSMITLDVVTDADGRYAVQGLLREYVLVGVGPQDVYVSPCSARRWLHNGEPLDLHVVARTELLTNGIPATLRQLRNLYPMADVVWGFVTERTSRGPRAVVGASVEHFYFGEQAPTGFTLTNPDGFYEVCQYYDDYGQEVRASRKGYRTAIRTIGVEPHIDLELTPE